MNASVHTVGTPSQPQVAEGQVWRERDPRRLRHVRIMSVGPGAAGLQLCDADGVLLAPRRRTYANLKRFNGHRGGYEFVRRVGQSAESR